MQYFAEERCGEKLNAQNVQKKIIYFLMFVHTYLRKGGTIINVKTPQYII